MELLGTSAAAHARDPKVLEYVSGTAANLLASVDDDDLELGCHDRLRGLSCLLGRFRSLIRLRAVFGAAQLLLVWHDRAKERVYAPGGVGAVEAMEDFCARAAGRIPAPPTGATLDRSG